MSSVACLELPIVSFSDDADPGLARRGGSLADAQSPRQAERVQSGDAPPAARGPGGSARRTRRARGAAHGLGSRFLCRAGPLRAQRRRGRRTDRSLGEPRLQLQPAGAAPARAAQAGRVRGERRRRGRRRQHRPRLRYRAAARSASFVQSFSRLGLVPDSGGTYFLPRLVGSARAMGLALLGERLSAEEAERWGLIWKAVEDERLVEEATRIAQTLAAGPTKGYGLIKQAIQASAGNSLDAQLDLERDLQR